MRSIYGTPNSFAVQGLNHIKKYIIPNESEECDTKKSFATARGMGQNFWVEPF